MPPAESGCPDEEEIAVFLRGGLAAPRMRALEAHVADCSPCRLLLSALGRAPAQDSGRADDTASPTLPLDRDHGGELPHGARFGRYVVLDWIGAGGMGVVYSAHDPELKRKVALKVLGRGGTGSTEPTDAHDLLLREARAMALLAHPNVVTVFDAGSVDGRVFIAMELVEGMTLRRWLSAERRTPDEIIATFLAAGQGLAAAHDAGLIHRDFKPDNVLIGRDGRVRVTDFGLARPASRGPLAWSPHAAGSPGDRAAAPSTGMVGTLAYMAPEQYSGASVDPRADQFGFAVALYEALTGERPREPAAPGPGTQASDRIPPRTAGVPPALLRALSRDPAERYPSMYELLAALAPAPRTTRRIVIAAIAIAAVAIASAGGHAIHLRRVAAQRTELVGRLRGLTAEIRTLLRSAHMLPLHDIRPARDQVRSAMREVERQRDTPAGRDEAALIDFVLGEGHQALGDRDRALGLLETAWAGGERDPHLEAALGSALGAAYEDRLDRIEQSVQSTRREAQLRELEQRYRRPAMDHLRAALAAGTSSPAYLEALIAFHDHRFADAARDAGAAFAASPTFYEAGVLEAKAHSQAAHASLAAGRDAEASDGFATARHTFARVLEIARSDDEAWLDYSDMIFAEANALADGELPAELRRQAIIALHNVRQINPENGTALSREAEIYEKEANYAIIAGRDPGAYVDQVLALASEARARGAAADEVDVDVCLAQWERGVYQGSHGVDPQAAFDQAIAACQRAAGARPESDKYISLAVVHLAYAAYEGDHGRDPRPSFELGEHNFRAALAIDDTALTHYSLGRLATRLAQYQGSHGLDPQAAVDRALAEYRTAIRMDATRRDAWAGTCDALVVRAGFDRADAQATLAAARDALDHAIAGDPGYVPAIRARLALDELDAALRTERRADPTAVVARMRADAQQLLQRLPDDSFAHRAWSRAELFAARWALARHESADAALASAASAAARARTADPMDAPSWTASAEVELLRAEAAPARDPARSAAIARGLGFLQRATQIDPQLVRIQKVRGALSR